MNLKYGQIEYEFQVFDQDDFYASGSGPDLQELVIEAIRYRSDLEKDMKGVRVEFYERREIFL